MSICGRLLPCGLCPEAGTCQLDAERHAIWLVDHRLAAIRRRILILSNKGGVGKSTVAAGLAIALARRGLRVGLLDADLTGPSQPTLLGAEGARLRAGPEGVEPLEPLPGLRATSSGFFLERPDDAVMWRDAYKFEFLLNLLGGTAWGDLDLLVADMPPGTGGELIGLTELLGRVDGAIIVTTPRPLDRLDARKALTACREAGIPVLGVVENMAVPGSPSGSSGPDSVSDLPLLGRVPTDHDLAALSDRGLLPLMTEGRGPGARALATIAAWLSPTAPS